MLVRSKQVVLLVTEVLAGCGLSRLASSRELDVHPLVAKVAVVQHSLSLNRLLLSLKAYKGETTRHPIQKFK